MGVLQVLPNDARVLVELDHAVAVWRVADGDVDRQQVAVGQQVRLAEVRVGVGLRAVDGG